MNSNRKIWAVLWLILGLISGCVCGLLLVLISTGIGIQWKQAQSGGTPGYSGSPKIGDLAPDFELANLAGESIRLSDLHGQPAVLNFWATWCGPCAEEASIFQDYTEIYPEMQFVAINVGESLSTVNEFVTEHELTFEILLDPGEHVGGLYRVRSIPVTYFLDAEGRVVAVQAGSLTQKGFEKYLKQIGILEK